MKNFLLLICSLLIAFSMNAQTETPVPEVKQLPKLDIGTVLQFNETDHDFGKIPYGKPVEFDITIKNISKDSVKVDNVKVGCGCTTPKYEQGKAYASGESFKITLGFSGYADGPFEKGVDIFFNNGQTQHIKFHGTGYKVPETPAPANGAVQKLKEAGK